MRIEEKSMVREKNQFCSRFFIHHLVSLVRVHRGMAIFSAATVIFWFVVGVWWSLRCSYMEMHLKWTHINVAAEKRHRNAVDRVGKHGKRILHLIQVFRT